MNLQFWHKMILCVLFLSLVSCRGNQTDNQPTSTPIAPETAVSGQPVDVLLEKSPFGLVPVQVTPQLADYQPSVVILWNEAALEAVRHSPPRPTVIARTLFMLHRAMYDVWALYDETAVPTLLDPSLRRPANEHTEANKAQAISQAAYHVLVAQFPTYEAETHAFANLMQTLGYPILNASDFTSPTGYGYTAAQTILAYHANDGSNAANNYADTTSIFYPSLYAPINSANPESLNHTGGVSFAPNHWQPLRVPTGELRNNFGFPVVDNATPTTYREQIFLTPHWGAIKGFALLGGSQFRPSPPPQFGSIEPYTDALGTVTTNDEAYRSQTAEILSLSANLTDEQKAIIIYWADGPKSETPPGHWNLFAQDISARDHYTLDQDVKLFFTLNGALLDASIAAWDAKRTYDYIRPISAIRHLYNGQAVLAWGGPNLGTQQIFGENWIPYQEQTFLTPPFPEYVSGHSTYSAAAAAALTAYTGSNRFYDPSTLLNQDANGDGVLDVVGQFIFIAPLNRIENAPAAPVVLQWATFQDAADQAGWSRRYGGIHFQDADLRGRQMGTQIGEQAFALARNYWTGIISR